MDMVECLCLFVKFEVIDEVVCVCVKVVGVNLE